jgi:hypothetical protein
MGQGCDGAMRVNPMMIFGSISAIKLVNSLQTQSE